MTARLETVPETGTDPERDKHEPGDARQVRSEARPNTTDKDNPDGAVAKHTESSPETKNPHSWRHSQAGLGKIRHWARNIEGTTPCVHS